MLKRTSLFEEHLKLGGRLIDFGGWELPVQYTGVLDEHLACRNAVGLFDVSHMGEVDVKGRGAEAFLNYLVTNNVARLDNQQALYTAMCNETGGIVDDLVIYRRASDHFLVVVNASNTDKDFTWMQKVAEEFKEMIPLEFTLENHSAKYTQIALQGRFAEKVLQKLTPANLSEIKTYWFTESDLNLSGQNPVPAILARTGYTGEDGFEIYVDWNAGPVVWQNLLEAGKEFGIKACGLGARDTLRLEMKYPLYGHELSDETNPLNVGLAWVTKLDKGEFVGLAACKKVKKEGPSHALVGIEMLDRGIPRQGYKVFSSDGITEVGILTSGTQSPSTQRPIGLAYLNKGFSPIGTDLLIEVRGTKLKAKVVSTPFYKRPY